MDRNTDFGDDIDNCPVALRKESVDRNINLKHKTLAAVTSLSARRAWIEIFKLCLDGGQNKCRSPQGERG